MGTLNWSLGTYGPTGGRNIMSASRVSSGAFTSSGTAANVTSLTSSAGQVVELRTDTASWINFDGTAVVGTGFYIPADETRHFEITVGNAGSLSVIEG